MTDARKLKELTRQELYDLIWSKTIAEVAVDYGVTEATVKNHCNNRRVPRPAGRYWRAIAAGDKPRKKPLPSTDQQTFESNVQKPIPKLLSLPEPNNPLHPLAAEMLAALKKIKPDDAGLVRLNEPLYPHIHVSKVMAERTAQAFHVLLKSLESVGIEYKKFPGKYDPGFFKWGQDRLFLQIEETMVDATGTEQKYYSWHWRTSTKPSGHLVFTTQIKNWRDREIKEWAVAKRHPLERVLSELVAGIRQHFLDKHRKRIQDAIDHKKWKEESERRHREWLVEETIRKQKEAEKAHADAVQAVVEARKLDLIQAAEWWRRSCRINDYIEECERRWESASGGLNSEHSAWLAWAKEIASNMSPFTAGYPNPAKHGVFDASAIPFGGPYPEA